MSVLFAHKYRSFSRIIACLFCFLSVTAVWGQTDTTERRGKVRFSGILPVSDSLPPASDSARVNLQNVKISKDGLDAEVAYGAEDSMWLDVQRKQVHLYGGASVQYGTMSIKAGYILLDYNLNEISAQGFGDTTGQITGLPDFKDRDQSFTADRLRYNFRSRKGIIYTARTKQEDLYVIGERAKFVGAKETGQDTSARNTIYNKNAIITTCDAPHPHFGIRTRKLKVIPDKVVVTGLSVLELGGVPTPFVLPFGFYPVTKTRKAGLIIPRDFEFADREGLGIRDWGWYQPLSQNADATVKFRAYTSGSIGSTGELVYKYNYKYSGRFLLDINKRVSENEKAEKVAQRSFSLRWQHDQDGKAHPSRRFGGSIQIQTNQDQRRNRNDFQSQYNNTLASNLTYSKTFPGRPYQFNAGLTHSQNNATRIMNISLPTAAFNLQRIFPFKRKNPVGREQWYEKISFTYSSRFDNRFQAADTALFTKRTLQTARIGIQHQASTDLNFKLFKYITISPNVNYEENWSPYTVRKKWDDSPEKQKIVRDTVIDKGVETIRILEDKSRFGIDTTLRVWGFDAYRTYTAGVSAQTVLFMTKQFRKGWLRGIRHKFTPSVSTGFGPDYSRSRFFQQYIRTPRPGKRDTLRYSIWEEAQYGSVSSNPREMRLSYSLSNVIEFKYFNARRDTVMKRRLFDNLVFSGDYNFTRDTLKWSTIGTGGVFRFFKGLTNLSWGVVLDPYIADARGNRINRFAVDHSGRLFRMTTFQLSMNTNFTIRQVLDQFGKKFSKSTDAKPGGGKDSNKDDRLLSWVESMSIGHNMGMSRQLIPTGYGTARDTFLISHNDLSFSGSIPLNSKWNIGIGRVGYDFKNKTMTFPDLNITRDLHCWQLSLNWQPTYGTYIFSLNVKPGSLDFLKVPYRKNNFDARL